MNSKIVKISKSGKTVLIAHKADSRAIGYSFAWAAAMEGDKVGDEVKNFNPKGTIPCIDEEGNTVLHEDGTPVLRWVF